MSATRFPVIFHDIDSNKVTHPGSGLNFPPTAVLLTYLLFIVHYHLSFLSTGPDQNEMEDTDANSVTTVRASGAF